LNKKYLIIAVILIISATFAFAGAADKTKDPYADFNSKAAKSAVAVSIQYGEKDGEITRVLENREKGSMLAGPSAFTSDEAGNIYVVDSAKQKVLKYNAADKKVSMLFNYEKSNIRKNIVTDIAVSRSGSVYLADPAAGETVKFSAAGKEEAVLGFVIERQVVKGLSAIAADGDSNLVMTDGTEPKIAVFDGSKKLISENALPVPANGIAVHGGKVFAALMGADDITVVNTANSAEIALKYPVNSKDGKLSVAEGKLLGIDASGNFYMHIVVLDKEGKIAENDIMKFKKDGTLSKKTRVPYYSLDDDDINIAKTYALLKEDTILSYDANDEKAFNIISFDLK